MKTLPLFIAINILFSFSAHCDVIDPDQHTVNKCIKITNASEFNDLTILGYIDGIMGDNKLYQILPTNCLTKGYKFNSFYVYGISSLYLYEIGIDSIDLENDSHLCPTNIEIEPYGGTIHNSNPIDSVEEYYRILGFTEMYMVLHKYKEVTKYNNDQPNTVQTFEYEGDSTIFYKKIQVGINFKENNNSIKIFPNPTKEKLNIEVNNNISQTIKVNAFTLDGKMVYSETITCKNNNTFSFSVLGIPKGVYLLEIQTGDLLETKKIIIE